MVQYRSAFLRHERVRISLTSDRALGYTDDRIQPDKDYCQTNPRGVRKMRKLLLLGLLLVFTGLWGCSTGRPIDTEGDTYHSPP
jgi:hypothetical protein